MENKELSNRPNSAAYSKRDKAGNQMSAPVIVPDANKLTVVLVPSTLLHQIEEYRADQIRFEAVAFLFLGAFLGVVVNWATAEQVHITLPSIILGVVLLIVTCLALWVARDFRTRANAAKQIALNSNQPDG
ncbi:MAG: hypothetical protein ACOYNY_38080 [Caldilineaceae bacterium]